MIFEKYDTIAEDRDRLLLYAREDTILISRLNKNSLDAISKVRLDSGILYLQVISKDQMDFLFILCMNMEWIILDKTFAKLCEGKINLARNVDYVRGCAWVDSNMNIILTLKRNQLTCFSTRYNKRYKGSHYQLTISDDAHCPVHSSTILAICLVKGSISKDYGVLFI